MPNAVHDKGNVVFESNVVTFERSKQLVKQVYFYFLRKRYRDNYY